jgi:anti-sigma factor NepR-like protein
MMQTDVQMRKSRGRLSRHVQNKLGETLHAMFDEIVKEGVPDRFSKLLEKINGGTVHGSLSDDAGDQFSKSGHLEASGNETEPVVRAKGSDRPFRKPEDDKGSS